MVSELIPISRKTWRPAVFIAFVCAFLCTACAGTAPKAAKSAAHPASPQDERRTLIAFHHFAEGAMYLANADYLPASNAFERALQLDPGSIEIRAALAEAYVNLQQIERAIAVASASDSEDSRLLWILGRCYRYSGREKEAWDTYNHLVAVDSTNEDGWWYLSRAALKSGQLDTAAYYLRRLAHLKLEPRVWNELGEVEHRQRRDDQAAEAFTQSLRLDSSAQNRDAYYGSAAILESKGSYLEAAAVYRRVLAMAPSDLSVRRRLTLLFLHADLRDSAAAVIQEILAINPDDPERLRLGMVWYNDGQIDRAESLFVALADTSGSYIAPFMLGRIAADRDDPETAKRHYRRAIAISDSIADGWIFLAQALLDQDSLDAALETAHRAMGVVNDTSRFAYFIGIAFARHNRHDSAVVWLERARRDDTLNGRLQFALAASLERSGQFDRAAALFRDLLKREPDNASALNYLGYMYADSGVRLDESLDLIRRALERDPDNGAYLDSFGWALYRLGRYQEAEDHIRRALDVLKSDSTVFDHLGDILAVMGRVDEAREQWRKALELDPDNAPIRRKLGL